MRVHTHTHAARGEGGAESLPSLYALPARFWVCRLDFATQQCKEGSFLVIKDEVRSFREHFLTTYCVLGSEDSMMGPLRLAGSP